MENNPYKELAIKIVERCIWDARGEVFRDHSTNLRDEDGKKYGKIKYDPPLTGGERKRIVDMARESLRLGDMDYYFDMLGLDIEKTKKELGIDA